MNHISRRKLFQTAASGIASVYLLPSSVLANEKNGAKKLIILVSPTFEIKEKGPNDQASYMLEAFRRMPQTKSLATGYGYNSYQSYASYYSYMGSSSFNYSNALSWNSFSSSNIANFCTQRYSSWWSKIHTQYSSHRFLSNVTEWYEGMNGYSFSSFIAHNGYYRDNTVTMHQGNQTLNWAMSSDFRQCKCIFPEVHRVIGSEIYSSKEDVLQHTQGVSSQGETRSYTIGGQDMEFKMQRTPSNALVGYSVDTMRVDPSDHKSHLPDDRISVAGIQSEKDGSMNVKLAVVDEIEEA